MAEIEPNLQNFGEKGGSSGDFPNGDAHFEKRVNGHYCICSENKSAATLNKWASLRLREKHRKHSKNLNFFFFNFFLVPVSGESNRARPRKKRKEERDLALPESIIIVPTRGVGATGVS